MGTNKRNSFVLTYFTNVNTAMEMKDSTFIIILLLLCLVFYTGNKAIKIRSNEVVLVDSLNVLESKYNSLREAYLKLEFYTIDVENICDKYKSSRDEKYHYHLTSKENN